MSIYTFAISTDEICRMKIFTILDLMYGLNICLIQRWTNMSNKTDD